MVHGMKIGNWRYSDPMELKEKMFNFFRNHYSCSSGKWKMDMALNFKRLNEEDAAKLEFPFSLEEIKEAAWSCDENKAPGLDEFNLYFFKKYWKIVQKDLFEMMGKFYLTRKLERNINSSFIALLSKNENSNDIFEFRPICLVSSLYKIVEKALSRRLRDVINAIVRDTQCTFIKDRQIFDGILITNGVIHSIKKKDGIGLF